jgi:hypothetical protein
VRGGAYHSFSRLTHEYGHDSDVSLEQSDLSVRFAGAKYRMIAKLGDIRIEDVTLEDPIVQQLSQTNLFCSTSLGSCAMRLVRLFIHFV